VPVQSGDVAQQIAAATVPHCWKWEAAWSWLREDYAILTIAAIQSRATGTFISVNEVSR